MESSDLDFVVDILEAELRPYRETHHTYRRAPRQRAGPGPRFWPRCGSWPEREEPKWRDGFASGAVYHGGSEHVAFLNEVYAINSQANPLHPELWPSAVKYEAEIVAMTGAMLGGGEAGVASVCGTVSSGGTESILLAMRTYRDRALAERGITDPEMLVPVSAHAAFDKAAQYFGIRTVPVPLGPRLAGRCRRRPGARHRQDDRHRGLGPRLSPRGHRPHRGVVGAGSGPWHRIPHRLLSGWVRPALRREARLPGAPLSTFGFPA